MLLHELEKGEKYVMCDHLNNHETFDLVSDNAGDALEEALEVTGNSVSIEEIEEEE